MFSEIIDKQRRTVRAATPGDEQPRAAKSGNEQQRARPILAGSYS